MHMKHVDLVYISYLYIQKNFIIVYSNCGLPPAHGKDTYICRDIDDNGSFILCRNRIRDS